MKVANGVKSPTFICHGIEDEVIPYKDIVELLLNGFLNSKAHLFLREKMDHNNMDTVNDLLKPLTFFFQSHNLLGLSNQNELKKMTTQADIE